MANTIDRSEWGGDQVSNIDRLMEALFPKLDSYDRGIMANLFVVAIEEANRVNQDSEGAL